MSCSNLNVPYEEIENENIQSYEKIWALAAHIGTMFSFIPIANFLVPYIILRMQKDQSEFIETHAKESLNFQISILIYGIIAGFSMFFLIGFILVPMITIIAFVNIILATIESYKGNSFRYPFSIRFIK